MKKTRITLTLLTLVAVLALGYVFATTDSAAEEPGTLQFLLVTNGEFTEVSYALTLSELEMYFDDVVVESLLEGNQVILSTSEDRDAASAFVNTGGIGDIIVLYAQQQVEETSWGCIKCCYSETCGCCPPDDPKDPDGD